VDSALKGGQVEKRPGVIDSRWVRPGQDVALTGAIDSDGGRTDPSRVKIDRTKG
jgi:hypothetical protein